MSARLGRGRDGARGQSAEERPAADEHPAGGFEVSRVGRGHSRALPIGLLIAIVLVAVTIAVTLTRGHDVGGLLAAAASPPPPPLPTDLVGVPSRVVVDGTEPLRVTLSAPPAQGSPRPTLRPAVAGSWSTVGNSEVFTPASTMAPCATYTLTVWKHTFATHHATLDARHVLPLHVACPSITALQEALARQGYIGAKLHPRYAVHVPKGAETLREAAEHAFRPFHGRLEPQPADAPPVEVGQLDETTKGALEVFQADHNLEATGEPNPQTWRLLLEVEALDHRNPHPYTWVSVTESLPETLEVHEGNHVAISSPVNTGVAGAETAQGVFPIFARYVSTTMTGTNPDGSHYSDPGVPWVNYFNGGDAVHGFVRGSYGFPQSNGCVELPVSAAAAVYPKLQIGDIVWVT